MARAKTVRPQRRGRGRRAAAGASAGGGESFIRVRMYRVGFGDCFLVTLPNDGSPAHILVDCGVHARGDAHTMERVVDDIGQETKRLDVVIATHAHQDHISGFGKFAEKFRKFDVGEVWLPWTENPEDTQAAKHKKKQLALADAMHLHLAATGARDTPAMNAVLNVVGNAEALKLLNAGINGGRVKYLEAGKPLPGNSGDGVGGIKGLTVTVLGPPRDEKFLSRMDPPSGDKFMRAGAGGKAVPANELCLFAKGMKKRPPAKSPLRLSDADRKSLETLSSDVDGLAFALDHAVNNTSVVVLLSYRDQHLLFPGDAQYGNWANWITGPDADEILQKVTFLKVAHHGSHNATPRTALEKMADRKFSAMVSTQSEPWPSIPRPPLMKRLQEKAKAVIQSDSLHIGDAPDGPQLPTLPRDFSKGAFWYDYLIAV